MISSVKSRRLMSMQAKKEKEELDRQNKGTVCSGDWSNLFTSNCAVFEEQ